VILVAGATGRTGSLVVAELVRRGVPVRGLTRSPESASRLEAAGAQAAVGDAGDPASLTRALSRVERLYVALPATEDLPELEANLYAVAEQSGAYAVVKLGAADEHPDAPLHDAALRALKASSLRWTVLAAGADAAPPDVAELAVRALVEEGHDGARYAI
jgi:uncharacterized protein YbjT (DUF2867 family)